MHQFSPVPYEERFLDVGAMQQLRMRVSQPLLPVRAEVVLTHGLGEHCRRYEHVASAMAEIGVRVWKYDLRGHGRSSGVRGDIASYNLFLSDLERVLNQVEPDGRPIFLFGHSFGGQVTARFIETRKPEIAGAVITSPLLRLAFRPAWWRMLLARGCMLLCPSRPHRTPTSLDRLSRDLPHLLRMPELELTHRQLSPRLFYALRKEGRRAMDDAPAIRSPVLLIHGSADSVTSHLATQAFFENVGSEDKQLRIYDGALHETHNDLCREQVIADIRGWLSARIPGSS